MKKIRILGFLFLFVFSERSFASRLGIQGGLSFANISNDLGVVTSNRSGIAAGIHIESSLFPFIYVQPELNYIQKGYTQNILGSITSYQFDYLEVPMLLKIKFGMLISFEGFAGPSLGVCINHSYSIAGSSPQSYSIKTIDFALHVGGGVNIDLMELFGIFANARYISGLSNLSSTGTVQNKGFLILAGIRVGI